MQKSESATLANYLMEFSKMRKSEAKIGFRIHLSIYVIVNTLLIAYNLLSVPAFYWFIYPLVFWGIGVTMNYIFGVRRFEAQLKAEEAKIEHIAKS